MRISAWYIAEQIRLQAVRESFAGVLLTDGPSELFYRVDEAGYILIFDYGIVAFGNLSDADVSKNLLVLRTFGTNLLAEKITDDLEIEHAPEGPLKLHFDRLTVPRLDEGVIKIAMFNLAQSVALDYFDRRGETLLSEIRRFTDEMENTGGISISRRNMVKFIGRTLNSKNKIIENLFIFDSPELTWDDEYLDQVHRGLVRNLELHSRFKEVEYTFKVVEDNLDVFRELYIYRESHKLEWVIIVLICIEVIDLLVSKLF
jgi:required for meiotic nuclear division protein 1